MTTDRDEKNRKIGKEGIFEEGIGKDRKIRKRCVSRLNAVEFFIQS